MRGLVVIALLLTPLCILSSYGPIKNNRMRDYYGEYTFVLSFDHGVSNYAGNIIYFDADYSIEQMAGLINEAGYSANLHAVGDTKTIMISVLQDGFTSCFIVYDKNYSDITTRYELMNTKECPNTRSIMTQMMLFNPNERVLS